MTRERLPDTRDAVTFKTTIRGEPKVFVCPKCGEKVKLDDGNKKIYSTIGFYQDGRIGELFLKMDKQGRTSRGVLDNFAIAVSWLIQEGVDVKKIIEKFKFQRFEPAGMTTDIIFDDGQKKPLIVTSPIDWAMRKMEKVLK